MFDLDNFGIVGFLFFGRIYQWIRLTYSLFILIVF
jgi:hypothetical protein